MSGKSFSKIYIHAIWHIKSQSVEIKKEHREHLYSTMAIAIKKMDSDPIIINGTANHVHVLMALSKNYAVKDVIARVKRTTSYWLRGLEPYYLDFSWQSGYAAFSVSQSVVENTISYIKNQEAHHKKLSFEEEFIKFLDLYHVDYDPKYLASYE